MTKANTAQARLLGNSRLADSDWYPLRAPRSAGSFGADLGDVSMAALTARLRDWSGAGEGLFQWTVYRDRAGRGRQLG
ncbi:hypothetical protein JWJ88_17920 [Paracoccus methylovorus]|uniref:Uncharacterized protein n=1 Tax=Paracoccus methylovorus TaxID=2812658 RepID=A0ABX7JKQ5_9RHOB|nr:MULTISPECIES: hypothetical protein [Paracoccus]QRZ14830.1 hypothetical protein JWJ88_17920 [Paracoccus methylovorus]